ncbi:ATP-dependent RNA helicase [Linderina pennispora]|nr:ATP-dependent RNA helicase [Linderina pennispora]
MWTVADKGSKKTQTSSTQTAMRSNKRRKAAKRKAAPQVTEDDWAQISLNPPPMPKSSKKAKRSPVLTTQPEAEQPTDDMDMETIADWDWKTVSAPTYLGGADNEIGGMVSLQEIDNVDCAWEADEETGGKVLKFRRVVPKDGKKQARKQDKKSAKVGYDDEEEDDYDDFAATVNWDDFVMMDDFSEEKAEKGQLVSIGEKLRQGHEQGLGGEGSDSEDAADAATSGAEDQQEDSDEVKEDGSADSEESQDEDAKDKEDAIEDPEVDVSAWEHYGTHDLLLRALKHLNFTQPTEIQAKTLSKAIAGRDIIGAAETGSGKTLAFGVPMVQCLATHKGKKWTGPTGLVLTPTRELAIQVTDHLQALAKFVRARVVPIVGGMSEAKQQRLLSSFPDIIVATPGRFWDLVSTNDEYLKQLQSIRFLAIDEADRMLEPGHFKELSFIFKAVNEQTIKGTGGERQTFVFSATLLKDMQFRAHRAPKKKNANKPKPGSMEDLILRVGFQDPKPFFVDVTRADATAATLTEARIDCLAAERDIYLYYFLVRYPARTLVFVNSIDAIRRLVPILRLLQVPVFGLHAQMEQRQRLKNVDRFRDTPNAVLVASDVAARGLDIPHVDHVVHYQLPRSGDLYVHRSGRTARANKEGLAIMLVSPEERKTYHKVCTMLKKDIAQFPVDLDIIGRLKPRVTLAQQIDQQEHKLQKQTHERNWFKRNAEELDIELDSDFLPSSDDEDHGEMVREEAHAKQKIKAMKRQMKHLLAQKIVTRGVSAQYLSSGIISDLADRLLDTKDANPVIPTLKRESALEAAKSRVRAQKAHKLRKH